MRAVESDGAHRAEPSRATDGVFEDLGEGVRFLPADPPTPARIESAVLHGHEPWAYLSDVLAKLAAGWPQCRLEGDALRRSGPALVS